MKKVKVDLPSGIHVTLSEQVCNDCYDNFTESQWFSFNNFINAGLYFPQIMQFVMVMIAILNGHTSWHDIILCNLVCGVGYILIWYWFKLYTLPALAFLSCLLGGNIFRFYLHFIPIAIISFFVVKDWKVLLFAILGGLLTQIVKTILYGWLATTKYNDKVAIHVSKFRYKK